MNLNINFDHLNQSFQLMALGMAGVFIVLGILYLSAALLIKAFPNK